jgi:hypothetical protein
MTPFERLRDDPRTKKAINRLSELGLPDEYVVPLLRHLSALPDMWKSHNTETPVERRERRQTLADDIIRLANKIEKDPEVRRYRIIDHNNITTQKESFEKNSKEVTVFLKEFADEITKPGKLMDVYNPFIPRVKSTSNKLKDFVKRDIAIKLYELLGKPDRNPIGPAVLLSNAVLDPPDNELVTSGQMRQVYFKLKS